MTKKSKSNYWSAGALKGRGWTNTLIKELLPKARYMRSAGGRYAPFWPCETVLEAEKKEKEAA